MMPAGKYYVGDLCYVINDDATWAELCDLMFPPESDGRSVDGEYTLKDGRRFACYSTAYGDGLYPSNIGSNLSVDSGSIGCMLVSDITDADEARMKSLGAIYEFGTDFVTGGSRDTGVIQFGRVIVETGDFYDDEE